MVKLLRLVFLIAVFAGFFVAAFAGFRMFLATSPEGLFRDAAAAPAADADTTASGERAAIAEEYRRAEELAKNAPAAPAGVAANAAPVATPGPDHKIIREWNTNRKLVALTFDDGPNTAFTPRMIELLKERNVRATFFLIGPNVKANPELTRQLAEAGFELGNHSWSHPEFNKMTPEKIREEVEKTSAEIEAAAGIRPVVLRPPYGAANEKVQKVMEELGLHIINWSIDTNDWRGKATAKSIEDEVMKNLRDGAIILMHDRFERSLEATAALIDQVRAKGYEFATVSELLGTQPLGVRPAAAPATVVSAPPATSSALPAPAGAGLLPNLDAAPETRPAAETHAGPPPAPGGGDHSDRHAAEPVMTPVPAFQNLPEVSPDRVTRFPAPGTP